MTKQEVAVELGQLRSGELQPYLPQAPVYPVVTVGASDNSLSTACLARVAVSHVTVVAVTRIWIGRYKFLSLDADSPVSAFTIGTRHNFTAVTPHTPAIFQ